MIAYINGTLRHKTPVSAILETAMGIAFELKIPVSTYEKLPAPGSPCALFCQLHVSQDDIRLFGFHDSSEKELFIVLTTISGIGPKISLSILSTMPISTFVRAIEHGEEAILTRIPGIGKKSAQRLILELRGRLDHISEQFKAQDQILEINVIDEVESALLTLGFNPKDIRRELALMPEEAKSLSEEQLIKETIRRLYQRSR